MYSLTTIFSGRVADDYNHGRLRALIGLRTGPLVSVFAGGGPELVEEQAGELRFRGHFVAGAQLF